MFLGGTCARLSQRGWTPPFRLQLIRWSEHLPAVSPADDEGVECTRPHQLNSAAVIYLQVTGVRNCVYNPN